MTFAPYKAKSETQTGLWHAMTLTLSLLPRLSPTAMTNASQDRLSPTQMQYLKNARSELVNAQGQFLAHTDIYSQLDEIIREIEDLLGIIQ